MISLGSDDPPAEEVGPWTKEKHERLRKYVDISHGVRRMFANAGSTYIDLYCGIGRGVVRHTGERIDGSALVAWKASVASRDPFTAVHVADIEQTKVQANAERLKGCNAPVFAYCGPAADTVDEVVAAVGSV